MVARSQAFSENGDPQLQKNFNIFFLVKYESKPKNVESKSYYMCNII